MNKQVIEGKILSNSEIAKDVYQMKIEAAAITSTANCGQFVNLYPKGKHTLLPRPISICEINDTVLTLVYGVVGEGTREFASYQVGDTIRLSSAQGNGYRPEKVETSILVGGGIGVPPLVELAKEIPGDKIAVLGFRSEPFLIERLENLGVKVYVATDDGSYGFKGNVIALMEVERIKGDYYYSCGPKPMLEALAHYCEALGAPVQVSLEERMGCGYGACVGCVCKTKANTEKGFEHKKVCKDGPVFLGSEVKWDE